MQIKVLSLNVWMGGFIWPEVLNFVRDQAADIIVLQEVYAGINPGFEPRFQSQQLFEAAFPGYDSDFFALIGDQRAVEGLVDNGNQVLSRWPILEKNSVFFDMPYAVVDHDNTTDFSGWPAGAQRVVIDLPGEGEKLQVVNIHGPVWMNGAELTPRRQQMIKTLDSFFASPLPTIIAGDSNATMDNPCWELLQQPHHSVFGSTLKTTFNMRRKKLPGYATAAVDVFLTSPDITTVSAECLDVDVSDHLPMVVELEL